jgi:hypothetical protein
MVLTLIQYIAIDRLMDSLKERVQEEIPCL